MLSNMIRLILFLAIFSCSSNEKQTIPSNFSSDIELYKTGMKNLKKKNFLMLLNNLLNWKYNTRILNGQPKDN